MMIISEDLNRSLRDFTVVIVRVGQTTLRISLQSDFKIATEWNLKNYRLISTNHYKDKIRINFFLVYKILK